MVVHEMHDFVAMCAEELAIQGQEAGGIMVVDAMAGRADFPMRIFRSLSPLPAPLMKNRTAYRTNSWFRQLSPGLVGIMYPFLEKGVVPLDLAKAAGRGWVTHGESSL
jgi:hypothetical protein